MTRIALTLIVFALAAVTTRAHHSYAGFFDPKEHTIAIDGTLDSILYANPHVVMKVRAADSTVYTVTWHAASWVERYAGVTKDTFKAGDSLIIVGAPSRDASSHEVAIVCEIRRPGDTWTWRTPAPYAPPS